MARLLYVTCNVSPQHRSRTLSLGNEFLEQYVRHNPKDEVQVLDLYRDSIQRIDEDLINALRRAEQGEDYSLLTDDERRKVSRIWRLADQFSRCDKYVFVTHSLNLWFPAEFKIYIDAVCVPDRTYHITPRGAQGLLSEPCRKSLHLHASPPYPFGQEDDLSVTYLRAVLNFLGISDHTTAVLRGDDPDREAKMEYQAARRKLLEMARCF